jgi:PAS domain S-box-containing protein
MRKIKRVYSTLRPYLLAVLLVGAVVLLRFMLAPLMGENIPFLLFIAPIVMSAMWGGFKPGVLATVCGAVAGVYFFIAPYKPLWINDPIERYRIGLFISTGLIVSWFTSKYLHEKAALQSIEERYRALVSQVKDYAIFSTDPAGIITTWNEGCKNVLGYDSYEFLGMEARRLFTPEDVASGIADVELKIAAEEGSARNDRWMMRKNGERFWASGITTALRDTESNLTGFTKVLRDLTDRKLAEERLRESEAALAEAQRIAHVGSWELHLSISDDTNLIRRTGLRWSDECFRIYGYAPGEVEITNELFFKHVHPDDRAMIIEAVAEAVRHCAPYHMMHRILLRDGSERVVVEHAEVRRDAGKNKVRLLGTVQDITERKLSEEERERLLVSEQKARAEAEEANRLKDEFLANVSHELRTPLNAILGWAKMLRNPNLREEKMSHALEIIERNALAQARLIDDLLDVSRIVSGKLTLQMRPVILNQTVESVVNGMRPAAEAKGIDLRMSAGDEEITINGDADRLQQVVSNLLSNAIKFTPGGGRVEVWIKRVNTHVELGVGDTGQGIAAEFLPHIFNRFWQASRTGTGPRAGLGLGLGIVRAIVEMHGGSVGAESPGIGQGATFKIRLPIAAVGSLSVPLVERDHSLSEVESLPSLAGVRVLVVDDDEDTREVVGTALRMYGAEVLTAEGSKRALELLADKKPDVLVSDINMPGVNGYQLIRQVRAMERERGGRIPAVALTAYARPEDRVKALQAGFQMHVPKPIEPAELEIVVATLAKSYKQNVEMARQPGLDTPKDVK